MTPQEQAAARVADPAWDFANDPIKSIADASVKAAEHNLHGRHPQAAYWTEVGVRLVATAQPNPHITAGAVLGDLATRYGITV